MRFFFFVLFFLFPDIPAYADCVNPDGVTGALIYNETYDVFQGCTPHGWAAFHAPSVDVVGCPNIGDVCVNGAIYGGDFNGHKLYAAGDDAPSMLTWGPIPTTSGMGFCDTSPYTGGSCDTGAENTQTLKSHASVFPAAEYCADLNAHGYSTGWYLPSRSELDVIYQNLKAGQPSGTFNFQGNLYWASSETNTSNAWNQSFLSGGQNNYNKMNAYRVRCIRR